MERSLPAHPSLGGRVFAVLYRYDRNGAPKGFELNPGEGAIRVEARRPRQKVGGSTGDNVLSAAWPVALEFPMLDRPLRGPVRQACFRLMKHMTGHAAPNPTVLRNSLNLCIAAKVAALQHVVGHLHRLTCLVIGDLLNKSLNLDG